MSLSRRGQSDALRRVARLFKIVTLVYSQPHECALGRKELAGACECDVRTVHRDLVLLQEAGIPITYDYRRRAYSLPEKGWSFPVALMAGEDAMALALLRGIVAGSSWPQAQRLEATLKKLAGPMSPALNDLMQEAGRVFQAGLSTRNYSAAPLTELMAAASTGRTVEIEYRSRSRGAARIWRSVDPYIVEERAGQFWELHGWCHRNEAIRTFALDQISGLRETGASFQLRGAEWAAFSSARGVIGGIRGEDAVPVEVVFMPPVAAYALDQHWPPGLTVTSESEGIVRLTGTVSCIAGLVPELLRWRRFCCVEGGTALRERMTEEVRAMAALYASEMDASVSDGARFEKV